MTIEEMKRRLMGFDVGMNDFLNRKKKDIVEMNYGDQLYDQGLNAKGITINSYRDYTPFTKRVKRKKGQPFNRVTLRDTGDFHKSFFLQLRTNEFEISAKDWKTTKLKLKYKPAIFGLTEISKQKLREILKYDLQERLRKAIA